MSAPAPSPPPKLRFLRAYAVTGKILFRYWVAYLAQKLLGASRLEGRWEKIHTKTAREIKKNILLLKGLFIKVGQMMSIMTQFLPEAITRELEGLQDAVPPAPYSAIEARFQEEFGKKPQEFFLEFERTPIASASLGQVHAAKSFQGEKLAVKVQYPHIEAIVQSDLKTLKRIFSLLNWIFPQYGLKKTYTEIREVILEELDFQNEAKNLETLRHHLKEQHWVKFPKIFKDYSTSKVLTLQFMEGVKISHLKALEKMQISPEDVAKRILHAYCQQIFVDGIYHADPHPGNFLIQGAEEDVEMIEELLSETGPLEKKRHVKKIMPQIVMMDFGAVARISEPMRQGMGRFMEGIIKRDTSIISRAMKDMGFIAKGQEEETFDRIVEFFYERLKDVKIEEIKNFRLDSMQRLEEILEFRRLDLSFQDLFQSFNVPKEWALLERTLILLMGLTTHLAPQLNPMTIIIPYAEEFVLGKDRTFADLVMDTLKEVALSYLKLPTELQRTLRRLNQGELQIGNNQAKENSLRVSLALNRLVYTLLVFGSLGGGHLLQQQGSPYASFAYTLGACFSGLLGYQLIRKK